MGSISQRVRRSRKLTIGLTSPPCSHCSPGPRRRASSARSPWRAERSPASPATIVVDRRGDTIYELGGESLSHLQCVTWQCLKQFPPVEVRGYGAGSPSSAGSREG